MEFSAQYIHKVSLPRLPQEAYLAELPALHWLYRQGEQGLPLAQPVTFLAGENGAGKSTLLEALAVACGFNAEGGTRNFQFSTKNTHSSLSAYVKVTKGYKTAKDGFFLRAESFYNVASEVDRLDEMIPGMLASYGGKSLHAQSHGESFLALMQNRFGTGLYFLDEPEAALSPARQMTLLAQIHLLVQQGAQFIIATHSPILMAYPQAHIYVLSQQGIAHTPYTETESYTLTKQFLDDPQRMLHYLLQE